MHIVEIIIFLRKYQTGNELHNEKQGVSETESDQVKQHFSDIKFHISHVIITYTLELLSSLTQKHMIWKSISTLTHWGCASPYVAEVPSQPSLAPTSGDARSQCVSGAHRHMATTLEQHTATYPQISYIPICWHRSNRYCFRFIIQSKWSLHRLSVETGNTELTWPDQSCIH